MLRQVISLKDPHFQATFYRLYLTLNFCMVHVSIDIIRIIILRYDVSLILSVVRQFVAILFVVTPAAI